MTARRLCNVVWHLLTFGQSEERVDEVESLIAAYGSEVERKVYASRPKPADGPAPPPWWVDDDQAAREAAMFASRLAMGR
jgi:hypothetical protein